MLRRDGRGRPRRRHAARCSRSGTAVELTPHVAWLAGLSPWPEDGFGLDRMRALLGLLDNPQLDYPAIHVVGTNGKSTATVTIEQLLLGDGLVVGATVSPHVRSWDERIRVGGRPADLEAALARVRPAAEEVAATQFETITAAALTAFAAARRRRRGRRGGARRALRRDERAAHAGRPADERRARAHGRSRRDGRRDSDGEACCCP